MIMCENLLISHLPDLTSHVTRFLIVSFNSLNHREKKEVSTTMNFLFGFSNNVAVTES